MVLTIVAGADSVKLKSPTFFVERLKKPIVADGTSIEYADSSNDYLVTGATITTLPGMATVSPILYGDLPASLRQVCTINGVSPADDGEFFIDGSACDSWGYVQDSVALDTTSDGLNTSIVKYKIVDNQPVRIDDLSGIWITDLCPACTTCETIYRLKYEVEAMKLWLNTLKDVSLYRSTFYDGISDDVATRQQILMNQRITSTEQSNACNKELQPDDRYLQLKGTQLLQQYMTTVHMWNYVVSRNNSSTLITIAPEDTTGFTVQTKRALTSCDGSQGIRCFIRVYPEHFINDSGEHVNKRPDYLISIYVPDKSNEVRFEPFLQDAIGADPDASKQKTALGDISAMTITNESSNNNAPNGVPCSDHKRADTSTTINPSSPEIPDDDREEPTFITAQVAGTYIVTTKFLPFIYYRVWRGYDSHGNPNYISIRGGTAQTITGQTVGTEGAVVYDFGITDKSVDTIPKLTAPNWRTTNPTNNDYLDAKTAPTCSVPFKIEWRVHIEWWIKDLRTQEIKREIEDYPYITNGIRTYFGEVFSDTTVLPIEPEPTSSGAET